MKTNNIKLLLTGTVFAVFGALGLQACSSSDDSSSSGGSSGSGGTSSGGTSSTAGKGGGATGGSSTAGSTSTGGSTSEGGATGGDMGGASEGGASGDAHPSVAQCTDFCMDEEMTCTFTSDASADADTAVYADNAACMTACAGFALGNVGVYPAGDKAGDSFACRLWHVNAAAQLCPTTTHCPHTGLLSKVMISDTTATGPCSGPIPAP
jgi:hypothetical protein